MIFKSSSYEKGVAECSHTVLWPKQVLLAHTGRLVLELLYLDVVDLQFSRNYMRKNNSQSTATQECVTPSPDGVVSFAIAYAVNRGPNLLLSID